MRMPVNTFKQALTEQRQQIGLWLGLANGYCAELAASAGFDWLLIDGEHAPNDLQSMLAQLQAVASYPVQSIVRPPVGDAVLIKQYLDLGVQTLLVPMVDSADQARELVRATRYPPEGVRGVGSALARASRWNSIPDYLDKANDEICLLVQIESVDGMTNLDAIAAVEGVDGVFIGPADLSAALGHLGDAGHPEVQAAIVGGIARIRQSGKAAGILSANQQLARHYLELGCLFVAVGVDTSIFMGALKKLAGTFKDAPAIDSPSGDSVY